jgi:hypothetical protein
MNSEPLSAQSSPIRLQESSVRLAKLVGEWWIVLATLLLLLIAAAAGLAEEPSAKTSTPVALGYLQGEIVDQLGQPVAARLYLEDASGKLFHVQPVTDAETKRRGECVPYSVDRGASREIHTAVSAHPFQAELPPGTYRLTAERGKEYLPATLEIEVLANAQSTFKLQLVRWISMADRGWYSGDTHVHLPLDRCTAAQRSEDLNVAIPLTYWVTDTAHTPARNNKVEDPAVSELIQVGPDSVIWPINTEYEIFSVDGQQHTLGAFFAINHRTPLELTVPPIGAAIRAARAEGALIDLDKHNWPWSMMVPVVGGVDLYELSNNHVWRTEFLFGTWYPEYIGEYMQIPVDANGAYDERGWLEFGFRNYYALLNCGLKIAPTAGTATGVHPVPIGFGRVYVELENGFDYDRWIEGLKAGRSFVTTGPLCEIKIGGESPGQTLEIESGNSVDVSGSIASLEPIDRVEVIVDGEVVAEWDPQSTPQSDGTWRSSLERSVLIERSGWIAVRCFERRADERPRFAHTGPTYLEVAGHPQQARRDEVQYLLDRVLAEAQRSRGVLSEESFAEFEQAAEFYREKLKTAR